MSELEAVATQIDLTYHPKAGDRVRLKRLPGPFSHLTGKLGYVRDTDPEAGLVAVQLDGRSDYVLVAIGQVQWTGRREEER